MRRNGRLRVLIATAVNIVLAISTCGHRATASDTQSQAKPVIDHTRERFALLVGVNSYVVNSLDTLRAPGNDVDMMKQLLIEHYSFLDDTALPETQRHIVTLVGRQATHQAIETTFRAQLIEKAKVSPGATIVFYFSGHGSLTPDEKHRTIVPSDARTPGVYDILDDDINDWLDELRKYTNDITFILDSCHSGAWTKGIDDNLIVKEVPADTRPQPARRTRPASATSGKDLGNGFLDRNDAYSAVYGCLRYETSLEGEFPKPGEGTIRYSFLTYYLAQTLSMTPYVTYREAVETSSGPFSTKYNQHPQAEGNIGRPMFGSAGFHEDPFVRVTSGDIKGKTFEIDAGASLGVRTGAYLAIYRPEARRLVGEDKKLANARVTNALDFSATAELDTVPTNPIPTSAKVAIVTPFFGAAPLKVTLRANSPDKLVFTEDNKFIDLLDDALKGSRLVTVVKAGAADWDLGVQKGCLDTTSLRLSANVASCDTGQVAVFYLVTPNSNKPLYSFTTHPTPDAVPALADLIQQRSKQENIRALVNTRSLFNNAIKLTIIRVEKAYDSDHRPYVVKEEAIPESQEGSIGLAVGQDYRLKLENVSTTTDLDVAVIALGSGGQIKLITPKGTGTLVPKGQSLTTDYFVIRKPAGLQTYKVIAYTPPRDGETSPNFSLLEQPGVTSANLKAKDFQSPLSELVNQAAIGQTKDTDVSDLNVASWTTTKTDVVVLE